MRSKREQAILDNIKEWESQLVEQEATDFQKCLINGYILQLRNYLRKTKRFLYESRWMALSFACIDSKFTITVRGA